MQIEEKNDLPIELRSKYEPVKLLGIGACGEVKLVFEKVSLILKILLKMH